MKIQLIVVTLIFLQCSATPNSSRQINLSPHSMPSVSLMYSYHPPQGITNQWLNGIKGRFSFLGTCLFDGQIFRVVTVSKWVPVANGIRGNHQVHFISPTNDRLIFNIEMPDQIPIDLIQNHFVFRHPNGTYQLTQITDMSDDILCFQFPIQTCFMP